MEKNSFIFNFKKLPGAFLLALSIIIFLYFLELFILPINFFTFRVWEALLVKRFHSSLPGNFYPNMKISMIEEGDLSHLTKFAVKKPVEWETDRYGYRKRDSNINRHKIVIIGDSQVAGPSLTQQNMLSEILERRLKMSVYPFTSQELAPVNTFLNTKRFIDKPPDIVILEEMEIFIPELVKPKINSGGAASSGLKWSVKNYLSKHQQLAILFDRIYKNNMCHFFRERIRDIKNKITEKFRSLLIKSDTKDKPILSPKLLFYYGIEANKDVPREEIDRIVQIIKSYDQILESRGIRFIFLPIPNKENIYYEYLPIKKKPVFLEQLIQRLQAESIEVIDTQKAFEEAYREKKILLYHMDDTHWNVHGVELAADLIERLLNKKNGKYKN